MKIEIRYDEAKQQFEVLQKIDPFDIIVSLIILIMILFALRSFMRIDGFQKQLDETNRLLKKIANEPDEEPKDEVE